MAGTITLGRGQILIGNYLVDAYDVDVAPHGANMEYFESYDGIIGVRKQLDKHTEVKFKVVLTESNLPNFKSGDDPAKYRKEFIEFRRTFLDDIDGKIVVVASHMFKAFKGAVEARPYKIDAGQTEAIYEVEVKEAQ